MNDQLRNGTQEGCLRSTGREIPPPVRRLLKPARGTLTALALLFAAAALILFPAPPARASPPTWRWPLDGHPQVLRRFTPPPEPWLAGHRGLDLAAPTATPVLAAGPGTVRFAGPVAGKGVITVEHEGGLRTTYLPVAASVRRGQPVTAGSTLGVIEAPTGHCQESCLHWGLRRGTHYLDPLLLLGHAPIRLLPFWATTGHALSPVGEGASEHVAARSQAPRPLDQQPPRSPTAHRPLRPGDPTDLGLLTRSASTPAAPAVGLGALFGMAFLITALRRHRRTRTAQHIHRGGQHRRHRRRRKPRGHRHPPSQ
ncbi:M23 family metallopeptidase [Nonomuraea sp. NPDC050786]|uniref:M23 family metallopeptidase n=1 Tax=Nonomuraea sp. NPDC050786 TaxID=3154840 RepID=UPI0033FCA8D8